MDKNIATARVAKSYPTITARWQALKEVRALADATIEQLERFDKGWDKGHVRDDSVSPFGVSPRQAIHIASVDAMALAVVFA